MDQLTTAFAADFSLPHSYSATSTNDFRLYLNSKLRAYQTAYNECCDRHAGSAVSLKAADSYKKTLTKLTGLLIESINQYYNGFPDSSYITYKEFLDEFRKLPNLLPLKSVFPGTSYYRIRGSGSSIHDRRDLFHIPLTMRTKIANNRFSIAGFPTLYLSNSLYVAWEELKRPDVNKAYCSAFKSERIFALLDLRKEMFLDELSLKKTAGDIPSFLIKAISFPLYFICSIKVCNPDDPFKPEYIFPQFTLRWARDVPSIQGVAYTSTRVHEQSEGLFYNLALPVCYKCMEATCDPFFCSNLAGLFSISEPQLITNVSAFPTITVDPLLEVDVKKYFSYECWDKAEYKNSVFYKMGQCLGNGLFDKIGP